MSGMKKSSLIQAIIESLSGRIATLEKAARASHAEATHESSKAENKYDTRGLEAAYLAAGQARQAKELTDSIKLYETLPARDFLPGDRIDLTALVELATDGLAAFYFLGPRNGGLEVQHLGREITVITPQSPLGETLMGKQAGQRWTTRLGGVAVKHEIISVC
jgi:hypothetical protein